MVIEGDPGVCDAVQNGDGIPALVSMLASGGNQGKKVYQAAVSTLSEFKGGSNSSI